MFPLGHKRTGASIAAASICLVGFLASAGAVRADFTIIVIPDTQMYTGELNGGQIGMFDAQTQWIQANRQALNIVYVAHVGDCVENGNNQVGEWNRFENAMRVIEDPVQTNLAYGIPYGIAVGNHDQSPFGSPSGNSTALFNQYFGVSRFTGRDYYGGHYGSNNDNHYNLFSAGGENFIAVHLEFDAGAAAGDAELVWAESMLRMYSDRRAIVVRHELITSAGGWRSQGQATYNALRDNPNLFLMLCGHLTGEAWRADTFNGSTVHTVLTDYQGRTNGGDGYLRIYTFRPQAGEIRVRTYSPWLDRYETDANSEFTLPYTPSVAPTTYTITATSGPNGSITPSGAVVVASGGSQTFTMTPAPGFGIADVLADGVSVGSVPSYTFDNVSADHQIHATFNTAPGTGDVVRFEETAGGASADVASVISTPLTAAAGHLYVAAIASKGFQEPASVTGLGLVWTRVRSQCAGRNQTGLVVYVAQGTPSAGGPVTATFSSAPRSATVVVNRYSGVATQAAIGATVSGNTLGVSGSCSGGTDNSAYLLPITTTSQGALLFGAASMRSANHTPGAQFVERNEQHAATTAGNASSVAVMDLTVASPTATSISGSFSQSVDWAVIGFEIRPGAVSSPDITVTPVAHDFGSVAVDGSREQAFVVRNDGSADLNVGAAALQGGDTAHFGIVSGGSATLLVPGASRTLVVRFTPASGGAKSTTLRISSDDPDENPVSIALVGSGVIRAPDIEVSPDEGVFAGVSPPAQADRMFVVGNAGNDDLLVSGVQLIGPNAAEFALAADPLPWTIAPGTNRNVVVRFSPTTTAPRSATLRVASNDPDEATVDIALSGSGAGDVALEEIRGGGSVAATTVSTSAALTARAGDLYLAAISCKPHRQASGVQGLGLAWSRVKAQCAGRNQTGVDLWMAVGTSSSGSGPVTVSFASAPSSAVIVVSRYSNAAGGLGAIVAANSNGLDGACSNGTDRNSYNVPMTATASSGLVYAAVALRGTGHAPGSGFAEGLEIHAGSGGSAAGLAVVDRSLASAGGLSVNGTFAANLDWAAVVVEIRRTRAAETDRQPAAAKNVAPTVSHGLLESAPNPFNPRTTLRFGLPRARHARLSIHDIAGRRVRVLLDGFQDAGVHETTWAGDDGLDRPVPSGVYFAVLEAGEASRTLKLLLVK